MNLPDIAYVPLLVKLPNQRRGRVVRTPTQSVDVLPTIAAALGVRIPWHVDGRNALSPGYSARDVMVAKDHGKRFVVPPAKLEAKRKAALRRQLALFGSGEPLATLYGIGPFRELLGRRVRGLGELSSAHARLDDLDRSSYLVQVSGRVADAVHDIAVSAGGTVVAVVPAADGRFWALVPRASLRGAEPEVYAIRGAG